MNKFDGRKLRPDSGHPEGRSHSNWYRIGGPETYMYTRELRLDVT
jgi:hypothetical protein